MVRPRQNQSQGQIRPGSVELASPPGEEDEDEEDDDEDEPPPHRSLHQSPPPSGVLGASGTSGAGSGPADTVTLTRVLNLTVAPAAVYWAMTVPTGWSL